MKKTKKLFNTVGTQLHVWDSALKLRLFSIFMPLSMYVLTDSPPSSDRKPQVKREDAGWKTP